MPSSKGVEVERGGVASEPVVAGEVDVTIEPIKDVGPGVASEVGVSGEGDVEGEAGAVGEGGGVDEAGAAEDVEVVAEAGVAEADVGGQEQEKKRKRRRRNPFRAMFRNLRHPRCCSRAHAID